MLTLQIALADTHRPWQWLDGALVAGTSSIRPYAHPSLEHLVAIEDDRTVFAVCEAMTGSANPQSADCAAVVRRVASWPLDYLLVDMTPGRVQVSAGVHGVAPVYLTVDAGGVLHGGWDLAEVVGMAEDRRVDHLELMRTLTYWYRYTQQSIVRGVRQLTERATATFDHGGLSVTYPLAAPHAQPRRLRADADPVQALKDLLGSVIGARRFDPHLAAIELSGGMDSAAVATALAKQHPHAILACGMLIPGPAGRQQRARRTSMIEHLKLRGDTTLDAVTVPPLHATGARARGALVDPNESTFTEAQSTIIGLLARQGIRTVFTGLGGDEMLSLRPTETDRPIDWYRRHPPWLTAHGIQMLEAGEHLIAPASIVHEASLMSFASVAPLYLRNGLWPVSPLADPNLVRFGEWLPVQHRRRKRLLRDLLTRAGLPTEVAYPKLRENLADVMAAGLVNGALAVLDTMAADSRLVDLRLVDGDKLRAAVATTRDARQPQQTGHQLFRVAAVELFLRALAG